MIRGGFKGQNPYESFTDIFGRIPGFNPRNTPADDPVTVPQYDGVKFPATVERWRALVADNFPPNVVNEALSVMLCESQGIPSAKNPTSGASGLFQHIPRYWADRSRRAGIPNANIFDPVANVKVAGWLYSQSGTWDHWECKPYAKPGGGGGSLKL